MWAELCCWKASGRDDMKALARAAKLEPNFGHARSVGLVLDAEDDPHASLKLAGEVLAELGNRLPVAHGTVAGQPLRFGVFISPDGQTPGSIETLCRTAVRDPKVAACVDALTACAAAPHPTQALAAKGWLQAYFAMFREPHRFHDAFDPKKGQSLNAAHPVFDPLRSFLQSL
jgi:hypothetical protein